MPDWATVSRAQRSASPACTPTHDRSGSHPEYGAAAGRRRPPRGAAPAGRDDHRGLRGRLGPAGTRHLLGQDRDRRADPSTGVRQGEWGDGTAFAGDGPVAAQYLARVPDPTDVRRWATAR